MGVAKELGQPVVLNVTFTVNGVPTDPTAVTLKVTDPTGIVTNPSPSHPGTGVYTATVTGSVLGTWSYEWDGTGAAADVGSGTFDIFPVNPRRFRYCTLEQAKTWMQIADTTDDDVILDAILAVSRQLDNECRGGDSAFFQQTQARTFVADNRYVLDVDDIALNTGITIKTDANGDGVFETTWGPNDFQLLPQNAAYGNEPRPWTQIRAVGPNMFPLPYASLLARRDRVQITATWGWPAIPADIKEACLILTARTFKRRYSPEGAAGTNALGGTIMIKPEDWDAVKFIADYRRGDQLVGFA